VRGAGERRRFHHPQGRRARRGVSFLISGLGCRVVFHLYAGLGYRLSEHWNIGIRLRRTF
jgi:hypothetical protein